MNTPPARTTNAAQAVASVGATSCLGFGQVRHTRLRPARHAFAYPTYFLMLPMRALQQQSAAAVQGRRRSWPWQAAPFALNQPGALSFFDRDHGDGRDPAQGGALGWLDGLLRQEGVTDADGEVWLHCYPRVFGYTFKPVSFWYCHRKPTPQGDPAGELRAIVVEVNNTFGERHCYLLDRPRYGQEQQAAKVFHVSPFCQVEGHYRFRFLRTAHEGEARTVVRIDYDDAAGPLLQTSVSGRLVPLTAASVRRALWQYPAMTFGLIARIHWQAVRLWCKRVKFRGKPGAPERFVTR